MVNVPKLLDLLSDRITNLEDHLEAQSVLIWKALEAEKQSRLELDYQTQKRLKMDRDQSARLHVRVSKLEARQQPTAAGEPETGKPTTPTCEPTESANNYWYVIDQYHGTILGKNMTKSEAALMCEQHRWADIRPHKGAV